MERNWERFDEPPRVNKNAIKMTLCKHFELLVNRNGYEALGQPEAVYLLYDSSTDAIAIQKADPRHENAYPLNSKNSSGYYCVHIKSMCDRHQIKYDGSGSV